MNFHIRTKGRYFDELLNSQPAKLKISPTAVHATQVSPLTIEETVRTISKSKKKQIIGISTEPTKYGDGKS